MTGARKVEPTIVRGCDEASQGYQNAFASTRAHKSRYPLARVRCNIWRGNMALRAVFISETVEMKREKLPVFFDTGTAGQTGVRVLPYFDESS